MTARSGDLRLAPTRPDGFAQQVVAVAESRARSTQQLDRRERLAILLVGGSFLAVALTLAVNVSSDRAPGPWVTVGYVVLYAFVSRIEYEIDHGSIVPTQLIFVPMLFVFPLGQVPLLVALGLTAGTLVDIKQGRMRGERLALRLGDSWYAVGPVLVLWLAGESAPSPRALPVYAVAITAQFALEFIVFAIRDAISFGLDLIRELHMTLRTAAVDGGLASVGVAIAFPAAEAPAMVLLALPPILLMRLFARERRARIDSALQLGDTYRRTALLLGDVIEADDAYTGAHSRDVVELSLSVARALALPEWQAQRVELVALLHDVGKIQIPAEVINKPGPLTDDERALINRHTIEGEAMLERVGGTLATVGSLVRSTHERWDGSGYPDGLAGEQVPVEARIVAACDAFSAMTSDRSYRRALTVETARAELTANRGTQFDPLVVDALLAVTTTGRTRDL